MRTYFSHHLYKLVNNKSKTSLIVLHCIAYLYSAQYSHVLQDSKGYLTHLTVQVQPNLSSYWHSPNWETEALDPYIYMDFTFLPYFQ